MRRYAVGAVYRHLVPNEIWTVIVMDPMKFESPGSNYLKVQVMNRKGEILDYDHVTFDLFFEPVEGA